MKLARCARVVDHRDRSGHPARATTLPSTWDAALGRRERHRLHPGVRRERLPGAHRRRGEGLRAAATSSRRRRRATSTATSCSRSRPAKEALERRRRSTRLRAGPRRDRLRLRRSAASSGSCEQHDVLQRARARPRLAALPPERARRLGERPARDLARAPRARTTRRSRPARPGSHAIGEGAELIRRGDADAVLAGGTEACMHPLILAGLLRDARARRRGGAPAARLAAVRRDPRRLRDGRGRRRRSCSRSSSAAPRARRDDLRRGARLRRVERRATTWPRPSPRRSGSPR